MTTPAFSTLAFTFLLCILIHLLLVSYLIRLLVFYFFGWMQVVALLDG